MGVSRVSKKWLTTVPADVRKALNVEEGDVLLWEVGRDGVVIVRVLKDPLRRLKGKYDDPSLTYEAVEGLADTLIEREACARGGA